MAHASFDSPPSHDHPPTADQPRHPGRGGPLWLWLLAGVLVPFLIALAWSCSRTLSSALDNNDQFPSSIKELGSSLNDQFPSSIKELGSSLNDQFPSLIKELGSSLVGCAMAMTLLAWLQWQALQRVVRLRWSAWLLACQTGMLSAFIFMMISQELGQSHHDPIQLSIGVFGISVAQWVVLQRHVMSAWRWLLPALFVAVCLGPLQSLMAAWLVYVIGTSWIFLTLVEKQMGTAGTGTATPVVFRLFLSGLGAVLLLSSPFLHWTRYYRSTSVYANTLLEGKPRDGMLILGLGVLTAILTILRGVTGRWWPIPILGMAGLLGMRFALSLSYNPSYPPGVGPALCLLGGFLLVSSTLGTHASPEALPYDFARSVSAPYQQSADQDG